MRLVTPARLRAVGSLLLEAASLGALIVGRISKDNDLRTQVLSFIKRVRSL